jgi:guanylate kinase
MRYLFSKEGKKTLDKSTCMRKLPASAELVYMAQTIAATTRTIRQKESTGEYCFLMISPL